MWVLFFFFFFFNKRNSFRYHGKITVVTASLVYRFTSLFFLIHSNTIMTCLKHAGNKGKRLGKETRGQTHKASMACDMACFSEDLNHWGAYGRHVWAQSQGHQHIYPSASGGGRCRRERETGEAWDEAALDSHLGVGGGGGALWFIKIYSRIK